MKGIVLRRKVDVQCWRVLGLISKAEARTELLVLLQRAFERGSTNDGDVAAHLLFEPQSRRAVAQRWLRIAATLGLLEARKFDYVLTEAGQRAHESQHVFVPEQGTWTVWATDDPILADAILRVDAWREPSAYEELTDQQQGAADRAFESVPGWIRECCGRQVVPVASPGVAIRIDEIEPQGEHIDAESTLEVVWDADRGLVSLRGDIQGTPVDVAIPSPGRSARDIWHHLLDSKGLSPLWDDQRGALRVAFDMTQERHRRTMQADLPFERPALPELGVFEKVVVPGISICAASQADAERWARWRLENGVTEYATSERFASWRAAAIEPFADWPISLPDRSKLSSEVWSKRGEVPSTTSWLLMAAEDWRL